LDIAAYLKKTPLFSRLEVGVLQQLAAMAVNHTYPAGAQIFMEGDIATGFFIIVSGRVKIYKLSAQGKEQTLHIFGPGQPVGEAAVFAEENFPAHAESMDETRLIFLPWLPFHALIRTNPDIALAMLAAISKRLTMFTALVEDLALKEVPQRLAAYLLNLAGALSTQHPIPLDITKKQLAAVLGSTPETVSRVLARFAREGLIELPDPQHVILLDRPALERIMAGEDNGI
jgi:CRP/FNR family transcriptional regulator, dissimilatory nitrate respiration regulator